MPAVPDFQIPSWQPGIRDPMHALDFGQLAPALRPTAANLEKSDLFYKKKCFWVGNKKIKLFQFPSQQSFFENWKRKKFRQ